ncbi:hypothetical protein ACFYWX_45500 [Streptomyces sp. NPDC002888]|uniref:hypothetical protein n=1 Tax=Streptomyces sp. NPDC002888 TaxID=3364668 RepID=UPI0036B12D16
MTLSHHAPRPTETVTDRQQRGPNRWFWDHLDSVIDAELLKDWPTETAESAESGKEPRT